MKSLSNVPFFIILLSPLLSIKKVDIITKLRHRLPWLRLKYFLVLAAFGSACFFPRLMTLSRFSLNLFFMESFNVICNAALRYLKDYPGKNGQHRSESLVPGFTLSHKFQESLVEFSRFRFFTQFGLL